ncbi:hypothetical protein CcCBS67573_g05684 [Chytriomyces confervae]|uniref:Guanylate cyclase domain-containing protein n=1 Tax=Chytriomyces confervae TaxID=246404 RepID=A0A507F9P4_9FUNG|nr:hypothetical protein CcCBS67573_g05684 [Chytriomyces confervae]
MAKTQTLIDQETLDYLDRQRQDDFKIMRSIQQEHQHIEFSFEHAERYNNWRTDELYIERSAVAAAAFMNKLHDEEQENLKKRQNMIAAEKIKCGKQIMKERRSAANHYLARVDARQERERKALAESHSRKLKHMKLMRNLTLREVEDPEIRIILKGLDMNVKTAADERLRTEALHQKEEKMHRSKMLAQLTRNQKEIEQMRELHLLQQKYIGRVEWRIISNFIYVFVYIDCELEILYENEALLSEHVAKEQALEDHLTELEDMEENRINIKIMSLLATQTARTVTKEAAIIRERQRREARILLYQETRDAKKREKEFWTREIELFKLHLAGANLPTEGQEFIDKRDHIMPRFPKDFHEQIEQGGVGSHGEYEGEIENDVMANFADDDINVEAVRAREFALFETLKKAHKLAVKKLQKVNEKARETRRSEQKKLLAAILQAQENDIQKLQNQQKIEMNAFEETQKSSTKADEDNAASNERLYGMLPKFVADIMKTGAAVEPRHFKSLAFLTADIVSFTNLSSKSSAKQVVSLLNRLYSQMDDVIDSFEDLYKLETIGDAYNVVAGLNTQDTMTLTDQAINMIECAQRFMDIVKKLDMSDQVQDRIQIRIGVHVGPAVGGVANPAMPKYSLFGDTVTITGQMEQTSRPMEIHISGPTYELVSNIYECEISEAVAVLDGKQKMPAFWLGHRIGADANTSSRKNIAAQ